MSSSGVATEAPQVCGCGGQVRWESIRDAYRERWLGMCECGTMGAFLPDAPDLISEDPLKTYLVGPELKELPEERPPWVRVMLISGEPPFGVSWTPLSEACAACGTRTVCGGRRGVHPVHGSSWFPMTVCIACGFARVIDGTVQGPDRFLTGDQWSPPDLAVKRLRRLAFSQPMTVNIEL